MSISFPRQIRPKFSVRPFLPARFLPAPSHSLSPLLGGITAVLIVATGAVDFLSTHALAVTARAAPGRPLDLPSGGPGSQEEEDAPETIAFYGALFEGDAFFWCLDRSCSMGWAGEWTILRAEVEEAIADLSDEAEFGLVAYGSGTTQWQPIPRRASASARNSAQAWLAAIEPGGNSCLLEGALTMLDLAHASTLPAPVGFIVSDGLPFCDGDDTSDLCLVAIPAANHPPIPIHTIYVADDTPGTEFLRSLAERCGGTFIVTGN